MYCRKSSEDEERQALSIESQKEELLNLFGNQSDIEIVEIIEESFSAKAPGRAVFSSMITRIENGEAKGIIAWHPDRLARNAVDGGHIIHLLDLGVLTDLKFAGMTFENNSQGKFMLNISFGYSKLYSDNLSENVKRGNRAKVARGWLPSKPPIGYLNNRETKTIITDSERFNIVRRMWDLMLSGSYNPKQIVEIANNNWGLRTIQRKRIGGNPLAPSAIYKIFNNIFYTGMILWNGKLYPGKHEAMITMEEFENVQIILGKRTRPRPHRLAFAYTGLMRCEECKCAITASLHTNRHGTQYTYYHCTRKKKGYHCRQPYVRRRWLEVQISEHLSTLQSSAKSLQWITNAIEKAEGMKGDIQKKERAALCNAIRSMESDLENLTTMRMRDLIDDSEFIKKKNGLMKSLLSLKQNLEKSHKQKNRFEPSKMCADFNHRAKYWFENGDEEIKRLILKTAGLNPTIKDKKLLIKAKKPFRALANVRTFPLLWAVIDDIANMDGHCGFKATLLDIKKLKSLAEEQDL